MNLRTAVVLFLACVSLAVPAHAGLVGDWNFDDPADLTKAALGNDLQLSGSATATAGVGAGDGAVDIGAGSHFLCTPDIAPNGGSTQFVNEYTVVYDVFLPAASDGQWRALLQTNSSNSNDGDYFVSTSNALGVGAIAYSTNTLPAGSWYRIVFSADLGSNIDGGVPEASFLSVVTNIAGESWSFRHSSQGLDGRHSLHSTANSNVVYFFADESGEDALLRASRVQLYDEPLSEAQALALGGPTVPDPNNHPPDAPALVSAPPTADTGEVVAFELSAADADADGVAISVDWGDGSTSTGNFAPAGQTHRFTHSWPVAGNYEVKALARDEHGAVSVFAAVQTVVVSGNPVVTILTPPYLQNVRTDGIVIMTETAEDLTLEVDFGLTHALGTAVTMTRVASGGGTWFHRAVLTGLAAGTEYDYAVRPPGGDSLTGHAHFHTAPDGEVDFKFSAWSDSQGHNRGAWTADPLEPTISMMRHMVAMGVDFGLTTGDLAENGGSYSDTRSYYLDRVATHLGTSVPWFAAWGNHDNSSPTAPLRLASDMPSRYRPGLSPGHGSYSFTYANCFFVCLDQFYKSEITNGWLEAQLASPEAQNARFRFLGVHVPPFCERWIDGDSTARNTLVPLLEP
ncbi:MAG: PKD domain-containing protein, partial [Verrucomicrobiales bacterium]